MLHAFTLKPNPVLSLKLSVSLGCDSQLHIGQWSSLAVHFRARNAELHKPSCRLFHAYWQVLARRRLITPAFII